MNKQEQLLSVLSCQRYLTLKELEKLTQQSEADCKQDLDYLRSVGLIQCRYFAGRSYFITNQNHPQTLLGNRAELYLKARPAAKKLGVARTCYHHLAGQVGVQLFQLFLAQKLLRVTKQGQYNLTDLGQEKLQGYLNRSITQRKLKTCIDFSERRPHLAGKIGEDILKKSVANGDLSLEPQRLVAFRVSHKKWLSEIGLVTQ